MRNTNKKGFTIVELVIVVAVIAILAAVLIPTFSSIIKKANESKDNQLIKHLNTALAADLDGDKTMAAAIEAAAEFGYDINKINASATDNEILWDSVNNVFCYLNGGVIEYIDGTEPHGNKPLYWVIDNVVSTAYSTYLVNYEGTFVKAEHSLDVTACGAVNVTYEGSAEVSIFTNGGNLTVNSGNVTHYGVGSLLTVKDGAVYTEKGTFAANTKDAVNAGDEATAEDAGYVYVTSQSELTAALADKAEKIALGADITIEADPSVGHDFTISAPVELNLNGYSINSTHNSNTGVSKNNGVFYINSGASLTVTGSGEITFLTNNEMGWNAYTAVISGRGDITIDGAVKIANLGGTAMSYAIDMHSWTPNAVATLTVKSGMIYSADYCAVRLNRQGNTDDDKTKTFNVVVDGGVIMSESRSAIFAHDGSEAADGIYNITINGGEVVSAGTRPLVSTWGWDSETVNITDNR